MPKNYYSNPTVLELASNMKRLFWDTVYMATDGGNAIL